MQYWIFKKKLTGKLTATISKSKDDPNYTTFLKHFGEFEIAHVEKKEGSINDVVLSKLDDITQQISVLQRRDISGIRVIRREVSNDQKEKARDIIRYEVERYCNMNNVDTSILFLNKNRERDRFINYLLERREIRDLCGNIETLRSIVEEIIMPF